MIDDQRTMMNRRPPTIKLTKEYWGVLETQRKTLEQQQEEILVRLQAAREMGDLSENGAYKYAKFELGNVRRQLRRVNYLLQWGKIAAKKKTGAVDFGSKVRLKNEAGELEFMLVSEHEADPRVGKLSLQSPLGSAVVGKRKGDKVTVMAPAGKMGYEIVEID